MGEIDELIRKKEEQRNMAYQALLDKINRAMERTDAELQEKLQLGQYIRQARVAYGMSQAELARRIGISKTGMNDLEMGHTADPRFSVVARIAKELRLSLDRVAKIIANCT